MQTENFFTQKVVQITWISSTLILNSAKRQPNQNVTENDSEPC